MQRCILSLALTFIIISTAHETRASVILSATESGSDVVFSGSGTLDLTGANRLFQKTDGSYVRPYYGTLVTGLETSSSEDVYSILIGPGRFGSGGSVTASSGSGDRFGFNMFVGQFMVPVGYTSNTQLTTGSTFANQTFASLGLTPGTYVYELPADTIILQIGPVPVPEPATLTMVGIGLTGVGLVTRRRRACRSTIRRG